MFLRAKSYYLSFSARNVDFICASHSQSGQAALIIILITVVMMTLGVSLITRTTQELYLSQQEAESARVFNAAEAGVEDALNQDFSTISTTTSTTPDVGIANTDVSYTITPTSSVQTMLNQGEVASINIVGFTGSGIDIHFGTPGASNCSVASLIVSTYYMSGSTVVVHHDAVGPRGCNRVPNDDFQPTSANGVGYHSRFRLTLPTPAGFIQNTADRRLVRIRPIYNNVPIFITANGGTLPVQQHVIRSTASNQVGTERRIIEVQRGVSAAPSIMDYALYSGGAIVN